MKTIAITGANGNIGRKLIRRILAETDDHVLAAASDPDRLFASLREAGVARSERIDCLPNAELVRGDARLRTADVFLHLAFARRNRSNAEIASSLDFASAAFRATADAGVERVIYLSSQGVYGNTPEIRTEQTVPAPASVYTMAKYAAEKLFESCFAAYAGRKTCIRLDSVIQSQNLVQALCRQAKEEGVIHLQGGGQCFSYIDVEDAAGALLRMTQFDGVWKRVYNVGLNDARITLTELAKRIARQAEKSSGKQIRIECEPKSVELWAGMDASCFMRDTGWRPEYSMDDMITRIYESV